MEKNAYPSQVVQSYNTSLVDLLCSFTNLGSLCGSSQLPPQPPLIDYTGLKLISGFLKRKTHNRMKKKMILLANIGEESDEDLEANTVENVTIRCHQYSERAMKFMNDVGDGNDDMQRDDDDVHIDYWDKSRNEIRLGMRFKSKKQLKKAITLWSVAQNREFKVVESRLNTWAAKCKELDEQGCEWCVRGLHKKTHQQWQITRWVNEQNCIGASIGNTNNNLTSTLIASYIRHSIEQDPDYSVKSIRVDIKNSLHVEISYKKAWHGGNVQIVHYYEQKCTCGKWQTYRFPCSHAISVCRNRKDNPLTLVNKIYSISTFRSQYASDFTPLPHVEYWSDPGWKLIGDDSKMHSGRGRKRQNRFKNEMDQRQPDEPRRCGVCKCSGHNMRNCPNSQPRFADS